MSWIKNQFGVDDSLHPIEVLGSAFWEMGCNEED